MSSEVFQLTVLQTSAGTADVDAQKAFDRIKQYEYPLEAGDTLQATLVRHDKQRHTLILGFHNVVMDVVSIALALGNIAREYQSQPPSQLPTPTLYPDYTCQGMNDIRDGHLNSSIDYWVKHFDLVPEVLPLLPVTKVRARQSHRAHDHHYISRELRSELVRSIARVGQVHGVSSMYLYITTLQVFAAC
ncbi:uncharacterized protein DSM5745_08850 [Aspergillus mulundensis]|uniref:Condensation domain-containing protein n=1 Tax=Aspergillus mulundensis TaxID=1810919 RepID=A0A3D8R550_9EURO|nr:hypothetical protein DSM5745_08850 [Aspergillus mulundensis]RDW69090.1 hypothetical protein DSM5745_08850 [Aspergillus mulundensis]